MTEAEDAAEATTEATADVETTAAAGNEVVDVTAETVDKAANANNPSSPDTAVKLCCVNSL